MNYLDILLDFIFPASCTICGKSGTDICLACLSHCPSAERECSQWIFPLFDYRYPPVKQAVHLLKYRGKKRLAKVFAEALHGKISEELADLSIMENFRDALLIPIPLAPGRRRERGFNQAELICRHLTTLDPNLKTESKVLIKPKDTEHQARIRDRTLRLKNIIGSFSVQNPERIKKRNIILIDDVVTTGATLSEARQLLRKAGARKIIAFSVAH